MSGVKSEKKRGGWCKESEHYEIMRHRYNFIHVYNIPTPFYFSSL